LSLEVAFPMILELLLLFSRSQLIMKNWVLFTMKFTISMITRTIQNRLSSRARLLTMILLCFLTRIMNQELWSSWFWSPKAKKWKLLRFYELSKTLRIWPYLILLHGIKKECSQFGSITMTLIAFAVWMLSNSRIILLRI
jgi:hypothetical protein